MSNETDRSMAITTVATTTCAITLALMFVGSMPIWARAVLLGCVAIVFVLRAQIGVFGALAMILSGRLMPEGPPGTHGTVSPGDLLIGVLVIGFASSAFRYLELASRRFDRAGVPAGFGTAGPVPLVAHLRPLGGLALVVPVAMTFAMLLLWYIPLDLAWPNSFGWPGTLVRTLTLVWTVAVAFVAVSVVLFEIRWRRLRPAEAGVFIRRTLAEELGKDLVRIERARAKQVKKRSLGG